MNFAKFLVFILCVTSFSTDLRAEQLTSSPLPEASPSVSSLPEGDAKKLLKEFTKAQGLELAAFKRRQSSELKELKASQAARAKEWDKKEKEARHQFFASHSKGPERRAYIQDYKSRREIFLKIQSDELAQRVRNYGVHLQTLKSGQAERLRQFKSYLDRKEQPPSDLWPADI